DMGKLAWLLPPNLPVDAGSEDSGQRVASSRLAGRRQRRAAPFLRHMRRPARLKNFFGGSRGRPISQACGPLKRVSAQDYLNDIRVKLTTGTPQQLYSSLFDT